MSLNLFLKFLGHARYFAPTMTVNRHLKILSCSNQNSSALGFCNVLGERRVKVTIIDDLVRKLKKILKSLFLCRVKK